MEQIASIQRKDGMTLRRMVHTMERTLERRGEAWCQFERLDQRLLPCSDYNAVIDDRDDEELMQALAGIEDPMEYIAQRLELKLPQPTFKDSTSSPQPSIRMKPEPTIEEAAGEKSEEDTSVASAL